LKNEDQKHKDRARKKEMRAKHRLKKEERLRRIRERER
jgi:hypothetical protein